MHLTNSSNNFCQTQHASVNRMGSAIGHELVHIIDLVRDQVDLSSARSLAKSELRAYSWQWNTKEVFKLDRQYRQWLTTKISELNNALGDTQ